MQRDKIIDFADRYLNSKNIKDASQNGLQFEGVPEVKKIAFGVSASLELIKEAAAWRADLIIVHHGLLWGARLNKNLNCFLKARCRLPPGIYRWISTL